MRYYAKHMMVILMLLLVPIYLISCSGNTTTSLPSDSNSAVSKTEPPGRPTALAAVGADGHVDLRWTPPNGATSYNLYWSKTGGVTEVSNKMLNVSMPFAHMELLNGTTYYYRVSALNIYGESPLSAEEVQATPTLPFTKILTKLMDPDAEEYDEFGWSVAIDGDYAVVGAWESARVNPDNSLSLPEAGAVYVFHRTNGIWDPAGTKLMAPDAQDYDHFGCAVSISGDYIVVGAMWEDGNLGDPKQDAGAIYVFNRTDVNTWDSVAKIAGPDPKAFGLFGSSVAVSGDYVIAGQPGEGRVYAFHRTGTNTWDNGTEISKPESETGDKFGASLAISGDYVIVGAYGKDGGTANTLTDSGAAYIFHRTDVNAWNEVSKIMPHDGNTGDYFGWSVAISGDYAAVGAYQKDNGRGAVYVFHRLPNAVNFWDEGPKVLAPDAQEGDYFGWSVGITDQYVLVGAYAEDCGWDNNLEEGAAYVFKRISTNSWDSGTKITIPQGDIGDNFGWAVAIDGESAIIGAMADDCDEVNETSYAGAAYLY